MPRIAVSSLVGLLMLAPVIFADGLFYRVPQDGTRVVFAFDLAAKMFDGQEKKVQVSLSLASVGRTTVKGEKCRWIEIKATNKEDGKTLKLAKMLIGEKYLRTGQTPVDNIIKGWIKNPSSTPQIHVIEREFKQGPGFFRGLEFFLSGPFQDAKDLPPEEIDGKLGKLACRGVKGLIHLEEFGEVIDIAVENRLHEHAPFGLVTSRMDWKTTACGELKASGTMTLRLEEISTAAKSELPDLK
jgi:hypothetical protein